MISIIIPTLDRSEFLIRALTYYDKVDFDGYIYIGDSSDDYHRVIINEALKQRFNKLNIIYNHYPKDEYNIIECVKALIGLVHTPYCVYSGDDDFLVPKNLYKCAEFLEENSDYSAAHGLRFNIVVQGDRIYGPILESYIVPGHVLESIYALERWICYMRRAVSTQYYVHRTDVWKKMYKYATSTPIRYFGEEVLPCSLTTILGKVKELDCLTTVFQQQNLVHSFSFNTHSMYDLLIQPEWSESIICMRDALIEEIYDQDRTDYNMIKDVVDRELWLHIMYVLNRNFENKFPGLKEYTMQSSMIKNVLKSIPGVLALRQAVRGTNVINKHPKYSKDFLPVYDLVTSEPSIQRNP